MNQLDATFSRMKNECDDAEILIKMTCTKHHIPEFIAMLKRMEYNGKIGHSEWVGIFSDGDGAMRPKFEISAPEDVLKIAETTSNFSEMNTKFIGFDAG